MFMSLSMSPFLISGLNSLCSHQSYTQQATYLFKVLFVIYYEGNGNPLQYSCLENPMDGEAW